MKLIRKSSDEEVEDISEAGDGNGSKRLRKIAAPSLRESVRTVAERLETLDALPSLLDSTPDTAS